MSDSELINRFLSAEFFALAKARLSLNTPEALTETRRTNIRLLTERLRHVRL
jgi:hypothetical protein